jgi:hypothetical protein
VKLPANARVSQFCSAPEKAFAASTIEKKGAQLTSLSATDEAHPAAGQFASDSISKSFVK